MATSQTRSTPGTLAAVDRFTKMVRNAVDAAKNEAFAWKHLRKDTGNLGERQERLIQDAPSHGALEVAVNAEVDLHRKLAEINLLISRVHLLRLREFDMRAVYSLVEANLARYRGDESKVSACELSLKALVQASNFMSAVANKLPTSGLTTLKDVVSVSAITFALDSRLAKVLDAVKSLSRSINEGAALQRRSERISRHISVWKCSLWLCTHRDKAVGEKCAICLEKFVPGEVLQAPPCGHAYHSQCLRDWMDIRVSCPLCQRNWS